MPRTHVLLTFLLAAVAAAAAAQPAAHAAGSSRPRAVLRDPTPLRQIAREAGGVESDGIRFAVVGRWDAGRQRYRERLIDSWSGRRSWLPEDCGSLGAAGQTAHLTAGRMLLRCGGGVTVLELASGRRHVLPEPIVADGLRDTAVEWGGLGRRWVYGTGSCTDDAGAYHACEGYFDFRTGAARLERGAPRRRRYRDIDLPGLPLRTVCHPDAPAVDRSHRFHAPPYWVGWRGLRRCRDGSLVRDVWRWGVPLDLVDGTLALSAREGSGGVYEPRRDRVLSWTLPQVGRRARPDANVVATRCAVFFGATLRRTEDDYVAQVRVFRAERPAPRDPRCRAR